MKAQARHLLTLVLTILIGSSYAQEYDDLYFNRSDRKKEKNTSAIYNPSEGSSEGGSGYTSNPTFSQPSESGSNNVSFLGRQFNYDPSNYEISEEFSETEETDGVDQELIDYYKRKGISAYQNEETTIIQEANPNFSVPNQLDYQNDPVVINNYYGNNWNGINNSSWRWRNRWNAGWGWNNWGGNSFGVGIGWNNWGWGGFHDPFWDPFWGPSFGPGWGWNNGWSWNAGFGWNSGWGWNNWCPAPFGVRPIAVVSDGNFYQGRAVRRGVRNTRGGAVSGRGSNRSLENSRNTAVRDKVSTRDYANARREYLNRSRESRRVASQRAERNISSSGSNSRNSTNYRSNSSNSRSNNNYSRGSSGSRSNNYSRSSSSSRSNSGYSRSSRSSSSRSSGSYSSGSRSRSSGSSRSSSGRSGSSRSSSSSRSNRGR